MQRVGRQGWSAVVHEAQGECVSVAAGSVGGWLADTVWLTAGGWRCLGCRSLGWWHAGQAWWWQGYLVHDAADKGFTSHRLASLCNGHEAHGNVKVGAVEVLGEVGVGNVPNLCVVSKAIKQTRDGGDKANLKHCSVCPTGLDWFGHTVRARTPGRPAVLSCLPP